APPGRPGGAFFLREPSVGSWVGKKTSPDQWLRLTGPTELPMHPGRKAVSAVRWGPGTEPGPREPRACWRRAHREANVLAPPGEQVQVASATARTNARRSSMGRINTNVQSLIAQRVLSQNSQSLSTSLERLSTGLKI